MEGLRKIHPRKKSNNKSIQPTCVGETSNLHKSDILQVHNAPFLLLRSRFRVALREGEGTPSGRSLDQVVVFWEGGSPPKIHTRNRAIPFGTYPFKLERHGEDLRFVRILFGDHPSRLELYIEDFVHTGPHGTRTAPYGTPSD